MVDSLKVTTPPVDLTGANSPMNAGSPIDPGEARQFAEILGTPGRSFDDMRHSLLSQVDSADPIKTMYAMTDVTIEAQNLSLKYSLATGLTSAVVSLFGTMLRSNQ